MTKGEQGVAERVEKWNERPVRLRGVERGEGRTVTATETGPAVDARGVPTGGPRRRRRPRVAPRLSLGHAVMLLAGLLAATANLVVLRNAQATVPIVVARTPIAAGAPVTAELLEVVEGRLAADIRRQLLAPASLDGGLDGQVAAVAIPAGVPVRLADLRDAASTEAGARRISLPVPRERAVGGRIRPEDRVDVIRVVDGDAHYVVSGARVLDVADDSAAALGGLSAFSVTIAVDAEVALCLAEAMDTGQLTILLSTGQEPIPVEPCRPRVEDG